MSMPMLTTCTPTRATRASSASASPASQGYDPSRLSLALAQAFKRSFTHAFVAAFAVAGASAVAQPVGGQAVHGAATVTTQGNQTTVTTQNGAGTSHSAINWQSFNVPVGTGTYFNQPTTTSTSINRVTGNNPSAILGTLGSNGRLVLVNPSGITVGAGAVVDTNGFTASTLRMSDADALAEEAARRLRMASPTP